MKTIKKDSEFYQIALNNFRKQFKDVLELTKLYVDSDNKVYAGEWKDSKGVVNFNGGYAPDLNYTILIK